VLIALVITIGSTTGIARNKNTSDVRAARAAADEYVKSVLRCDTETTNSLRAYEKAEKSEIDLGCSKECQTFNLLFERQDGGIKKDKAYGFVIKQVPFMYRMSCNGVSAPYTITMDYEPETKRWLVYLESVVGQDITKEVERTRSPHKDM